MWWQNHLPITYQTTILITVMVSNEIIYITYQSHSIYAAFLTFTNISLHKFIMFIVCIYIMIEVYCVLNKFKRSFLSDLDTSQIMDLSMNKTCIQKNIFTYYIIKYIVYILLCNPS